MSRRIVSIDILRGIVMVIMALDHARDYFSNFKFDPTDLQHTNTAMFFTRWVTHFCAPVFIFLSGTSAFLSLSKKGTKKDAFSRLFTRGLWLIIVEVTIVRYGWAFDFDYSLIFLQVIWAIGCSMVVLSVLIFLPIRIILAIGLIMIFGHNMLDNLHPANGSMSVFWLFLHVQTPLAYGQGNTVMILYPLVPWIGVMAVGYCFGTIFSQPEQQRHKTFYLIGGSAILLFVVLRAVNIYGDPAPWSVQTGGLNTALSFINVSKYPPSLLYLLLTLGPAIVSLPLLEKVRGTAGNIFTVYGRVPLFYYVLHIYLLHSMAIVFGYLLKGDTNVTAFVHPGYTLPSVYIFWLLSVVILYWPCGWFMRVKMNNRQWWLSYL
jgi:uncharacterized membrane protein